jgi:hypothetical protein
MKWMYNASGDLVPYGQGDPSRTLKVIYDPMKYRQHNGPLTDHRQLNGPLTRERFEDPPTPALAPDPDIPESVEFGEAISGVGKVIEAEINKVFEAPLALANSALDGAKKGYEFVKDGASKIVGNLIGNFKSFNEFQFAREINNKVEDAGFSMFGKDYKLRDYLPIGRMLGTVYDAVPFLKGSLPEFRHITANKLESMGMLGPLSMRLNEYILSPNGKGKLILEVKAFNEPANLRSYLGEQLKWEMNIWPSDNPNMLFLEDDGYVYLQDFKKNRIETQILNGRGDPPKNEPPFTLVVNDAGFPQIHDKLGVVTWTGGSPTKDHCKYKDWDNCREYNCNWRGANCEREQNRSVTNGCEKVYLTRRGWCGDNNNPMGGDYIAPI